MLNYNRSVDIYLHYIHLFKYTNFASSGDIFSRGQFTCSLTSLVVSIGEYNSQDFLYCSITKAFVYLNI